MKQTKLSDVRREVERLRALGENEEAAALWKQGVIEMYAGTIDDDESPNSNECVFIG